MGHSQPVSVRQAITGEREAAQPRGVRIGQGQRTVFTVGDAVMVKWVDARMPAGLSKPQKRKWGEAHARCVRGVVTSVNGDGIVVREHAGVQMEGSHAWAQNNVCKL